MPYNHNSIKVWGQALFKGLAGLGAEPQKLHVLRVLQMDDKRELLKLKQGLTDKEDSPLRVDEPTVYDKPTGGAAVSNFLYHYKIHLSFAAFFVMVAAVLLYYTLSMESPDITILFVADNEEASAFYFGDAASLQSAIEIFTPDFNENGKVYAKCLTIDLFKEGRSRDYINGNVTKLFGEVHGGNAMIFVGNRDALESIPGSGNADAEDFYMNLSLFDDFDSYNSVVDGIYFPIRGSVLEEYGEYEYMRPPKDLYLAVRDGAGENDLTVLRNILEQGCGDPDAP